MSAYACPALAGCICCVLGVIVGITTRGYDVEWLSLVRITPPISLVRDSRAEAVIPSSMPSERV